MRPADTVTRRVIAAVLSIGVVLVALIGLSGDLADQGLAIGLAVGVTMLATTAILVDLAGHRTVARVLVGVAWLPALVAIASVGAPLLLSLIFATTLLARPNAAAAPSPNG
jgi:hypothetical protein